MNCVWCPSQIQKKWKGPVSGDIIHKEFKVFFREEALSSEQPARGSETQNRVWFTAMDSWVIHIQMETKATGMDELALKRKAEGEQSLD